MIVGFYGILGEVIGREVEMDRPGHVRTVGELRRHLATLHPEAARELAAARSKASIDDRLVGDEVSVEGEDRVEFFPPLSGG